MLTRCPQEKTLKEKYVFRLENGLRNKLESILNLLFPSCFDDRWSGGYPPRKLPLTRVCFGHCYSRRQATLTALGEDGDLGCSGRGAGDVPSPIKEELRDHWAFGP